MIETTTRTSEGNTTCELSRSDEDRTVLDNENELVMLQRSNTTTRRQPLREGTRPVPATTPTPRPVLPRRRRKGTVTFHDDVTIHTVECWRHTLDTIEKRTVWYTGNELRRMMVLYRRSNNNSHDDAIVGGIKNQYQPQHQLRKKRKRSVTITEEYVDPQKRGGCAAVVDRTTKNTTTKRRIAVRTMMMKTPSNVATQESRRNHNFLLALNQSFSIRT